MHLHPLVPALLLGVLSACGSAPQALPSPAQPSAVGSPVGPPATASIGASGGQLALPDGSVRIEIPAGALTGTQSVGLQEISNTAPGVFGKAYRLTPEGTIFAKPVRLTLALPAEQLSAAPLEALLVGTQQGGVWKSVPVVERNAQAHSVTVQTNHFSDWSAVPGVQLDPSMAHVPEGGTVALRVQVCDETRSGLLEGTFECGPNMVASHVVRHWSVNGVESGTATVGQVAPGTPARRPTRPRRPSPARTPSPCSRRSVP